MNSREILSLIYSKKDYEKAEILCKGEGDRQHLAESLYLQKKFSEAAKIYHELGKFAEEGYCHFYDGNKSLADTVWISPLIQWAKLFSGYIERKRNGFPTFFQIRNFYENDLDMLLLNGFEDYAENLIDSIQFFEDINPEIYKFTARALYNHKYYDFADKFLSVAKKYGEEDSELYVLDAKNNIAQKRYYSAVKSLEKSLDISKDYCPAKILFENVKRYC